MLEGKIFLDLYEVKKQSLFSVKLGHEHFLFSNLTLLVNIYNMEHIF